VKAWGFILSIVVILTIHPQSLYSRENNSFTLIDFYGDTALLPIGKSLVINFDEPVTKEAVQHFYDKANAAAYQPVIDSLLAFRERNQLNDWFYYQLIRKTAQSISPKEDNYPRYTLYKWFFLAKSGYDANLAISDGQLIFYVRSEDSIYDIPYYTREGKHYVCLNMHDYANKSFDFEKDGIYPTDITVQEGVQSFSYKVTRIPSFSPTYYAEKDIQFKFGHKAYQFKVKVNPQINTIFANYPVTDIESYFNIPLSDETYNSLIPELKKNVSKMDQQTGVDYLMEFTRNAFLYKDDKENFGKEKRMSPEQTLLYNYSDCDDRAAFFFYLVKEIYNLPMVALLYPTHLTIAVKFDNPPAKSFTYKGNQYAICEPTSPLLSIGETNPELSTTSYRVAYEYNPGR